MRTLATLHALLPAARLHGDAGTRIARVHTDTRTLQPGDLFVALKGERFDAHDFLPQARDAGAAAVLAERGVAACGLPGLEVADSLRALQSLAQGWRAGLMLPLVAVTGSNGKTTVTQMIAAILRAWVGDAALATAGNLNNHIGAPLTLLRLSAQTRAAVVELGMNHPGEIAELAALAAPTVALVNNAQREHQEFMQSVEAVARENGAVISALPPTGCAVFPADDAYSGLWRQLAGERRVLRFGDGGEVQVEGTWDGDHWRATLHAPVGDTAFALHIAGAHNLRNAAAAAAAALAAGAPLAAVQAGLATFRPVAGRSAARAITWHGHAATLVDDSYNANPDSVRAAIDVLAGLPGPQWLVLGDMGEVGDQGPAFHAEVGTYARERGLPALWCAGPQSAGAAQAFGTGARHFDDTSALLAALVDDADMAPDAASVLVKGSRFMRMERVVQALAAAEEGASCS
ncbi:UDP-N-acetylmuramoyl-tripeptide--D-alanyl-D-alanine ligase [Rubrivivax albus]|uniref:UDP-N-acetylmuramoyl-tripeptide--D-alanyl-D-alanine ligase n=1 Tax=Rubrivivax albus TaxID=2499835 RepID=A0A3S2U4S2_9BURK|nr:UDP-N-acetylmuramoyl-tripeptide--D-alanyl-D-alanine ligase [Rubrivivax albus]RVT53586.1 UDP-N-acetylmuramoyl-tripeptide--D-alanyl-D-alanine ligase [Rubrivivax albus]